MKVDVKELKRWACNEAKGHCADCSYSYLMTDEALEFSCPFDLVDIAIKERGHERSRKSDDE